MSSSSASQNIPFSKPILLTQHTTVKKRVRVAAPKRKRTKLMTTVLEHELRLRLLEINDENPKLTINSRAITDIRAEYSTKLPQWIITRTISAHFDPTDDLSENDYETDGYSSGYSSGRRSSVFGTDDDNSE
jgi:hypothetical protein